jgi:hypothetical protein
MLGGRGGGGPPGGAAEGGGRASGQAPAPAFSEESSGSAGSTDFDDDIPF